MKHNSTLSKTIVFITGAFIGNNCWDEWKIYFESHGYRCLVMPWPYKDASPEALRNRDPETPIASITLNELMDRFVLFIGSLPEKPIVIGHSLGGLIVQLLLQRGLAPAGVAIHPFPASGGGYRFSLLREWWEAMGFFTPSGEPYLMSFKKWKADVTTGMSCEQQKELYYKYVVPESKLLIRDLLTRKARVHPEYVSMPLLILSGGLDRVSPPLQNYRQYRKYAAISTTIGYKELKGFNHLIFGSPRWVEIADYILSWLRDKDIS